MTKQLIKGNTAVAEAALRAGLEAYFGYPITPRPNYWSTFLLGCPNWVVHSSRLNQSWRNQHVTVQPAPANE